MGSGWKRNVGSLRSFISNSMGGLKGGNNLASWAVAFTLAYYLWVKPERDLKKEQEARAAAASAAVFDSSRSVEK
ncbi:unnamed protein product [Victoria cruziana]